MKKNRGNETIRIIIHIYMEVSQGNYLKQAKMSFYFSSTKSENRWVEQILLGVGMCWAFGISRRVGGGKRV
jgi:hypothetical protein